MKKRVVLITHSCFWMIGAGFWARTRELVKFLALHSQLTVFVLKRLNYVEISRIRQMFGNSFDLVSAPAGPRVTVSQGKKVIDSIGENDIYIVDKTENAPIFDVLPAASQKFVDTHDLISQRTQSAFRYNAKSGVQMSEQQEVEVLKKFNGVICIQPEDYLWVARRIGKSKAILAPHPVKATPQPLNEKARKIGFVASDWYANVDGLKWFLEKVWPKVARPGISLNIYGGISKKFNNYLCEGIIMHGVVPNQKDIYSRTDIIINPVLWGAGLKIKTIEALANGLPLVTNSEGARGLRQLDGKAFLVASCPDSFVGLLNALIGDFAQRQRLGKEGLAFVNRYLQPERCFRDLLSAINNPGRYSS